MNAGAPQRFEFFRSRAFTAHDDSARVPHALSRRSCFAGNKGNDRFFHVFPGEFSGFLFGGAFLGCFLAALVIFLIGYANYFSLAVSGDLLQGNELENVPNLFHARWLIALLLLSIAILIASMIALFSNRSSLK